MITMEIAIKTVAVTPPTTPLLSVQVHAATITRSGECY